jgi:HD superfamily phosphohydrolase
MMNTKLCKHVKDINDCIHGYISITLFAKYIIDTPIFQRLRRILQLSTCQYIFPNARHTRFEHSIGTYHIAGLLVKRIEETTNKQEMHTYLLNIPELRAYLESTYRDSKYIFDKYIQELIKIAALTHDIGHGPFSHMFDDIILEGNDNNTHEKRSCILLKKIIKEHPVLSELIPESHIIFMQSLIYPTSINTGFVYQIVSNNVTGLDVDKYDYLIRDSYSVNTKISFDSSRLVHHILVINNNICYPVQAAQDIFELFRSRYRLHKILYAHKGVISVQLMFMDIIRYLDQVLKIHSSIENMDKFVVLTDEYITNMMDILLNNSSFVTEQQLTNIRLAKDIWNKINTRNLYGLACQIATKEKLDLKEFYKMLDKYSDDVCIYQTQIGYVSGNKPNPLDNIYIYKTQDAITLEKINSHVYSSENITCMLPEKFIEHIVMIFCKKKDIIKNINNLFCEFIEINYFKYLGNII